MREFITWDKKKKTFLEPEDFVIDNNSKVYKWLSDNTLKPFKENEVQLLKDIELKDIEGKSIYADCSVIEFDYLFDDGKSHYKGYFTYDNENARYKIRAYEFSKDKKVKINNTLWHIPFEKSRVTNIKIIDTIQENKLGLIK